MNKLTTERDILLGAIDALGREAALQLDIVEFDVEKGDKRIDAILRMPGRGGKLFVEVKKWASHINLGAVINQLEQVAEPGKGLLVADYINPNMGKKLKALGIQFIDVTGNAYLNRPPIYIYIRGNKPQANTITKAKTGKAFQPSGMKIVYGLLKDPELANASYRKIAGQTHVALGTVGWVIGDLIEQGFVLEGVKEGRQLVDFDLLLDKWVEAYPHRLREKQYLGSFTTDNVDWWRVIKPEGFGAAWSGEIAAAEYIHYLNPKDAVVYIRKKNMTNFLKKAKLKKIRDNEIPNIRIDLIEPFWKTEEITVHHPSLVDPIIVYADLVQTGDSRNLDTANRLREKYLR